MAAVRTSTATARLRAARDFLLNHRENYATAYRDYRPPALEEFNWALDWFDAIAADGGDRPALWIVQPDGGPGLTGWPGVLPTCAVVSVWP